MRLFKLNARRWGNLHAPVASGWMRSAEGKVLRSFQVFDCKSLWSIEIQSCGLTSNHIQYWLCVYVWVCVPARCSPLFWVGSQKRKDSDHESYKAFGVSKSVQTKRHHWLCKLSDVAVSWQTVLAGSPVLVKMLTLNPKVNVQTQLNYSVSCCTHTGSLKWNLRNLLQFQQITIWFLFFPVLKIAAWEGIFTTTMFAHAWR